MKTIDLRPVISSNAEMIVDRSKQQIIITSEEELSAPDLMLAVMRARYSEQDDPLIGYKVYVNGEYVAKIKK